MEFSASIFSAVEEDRHHWDCPQAAHPHLSPTRQRAGLRNIQHNDVCRRVTRCGAAPSQLRLRDSPRALIKLCQRPAKALEAEIRAIDWISYAEVRSLTLRDGHALDDNH